MSFTNQTTHYGLPQWIGTDKPTYLIDQNNAYQKIDTEIYNANATASEAMTNADSATGKVSGAIETANNALDVANGAVTTANQATTIANNANTVAGGAVTTANKAEVTAQKALDSIVDITGWKYSTNCATLNATNAPISLVYTSAIYNTALKTLHISWRANATLTSDITPPTTTIDGKTYYLLWKLNITSTSSSYAALIPGLAMFVNTTDSGSKVSGSYMELNIILYDGFYYIGNVRAITIPSIWAMMAFNGTIVFNDANLNLSAFTDVPAPPAP